jgi:glucosamine-6-phosphate deaminase
MIISISCDAHELGHDAAVFAATRINDAIKQKDEARIMLSTGNSQFELLQSLIGEKINWKKVEIFHLDEYIGIPSTHPASFRKYLYDRFISKIEPKQFHGVDVDVDIDLMIQQLTKEISRKPIDLGLIGIGVNAHIAFNDPPADFDTHESYRIVSLDEVCRKQQVDEGWFSNLDEVPDKAVSMTPWQIMQCGTIISCVPHRVKAPAVKMALINEVTEIIPATLLKTHSDFHLFLDKDSASEIIPL